jgi:hypothetical protein
MPASVRSKKARRPPDRCELTDGWLEWCGRWALVEPGTEAGSGRGAARDDGLDGDRMREATEGSQTAGISGNGDGDGRDEFDAAAI